jgi:hypothetical protein
MLGGLRVKLVIEGSTSGIQSKAAKNDGLRFLFQFTATKNSVGKMRRLLVQ